MSATEKEYWLVTDKRLVPFYQGIESFCHDHLPRSAPDIDDTSYKIFADPIEGYVHLAAWEVAIVDTPLFQRLRGIRQLGLAYLVYPTLGYCRFQHTLGVLARLKQVLDQLETNQALRAGNKDSHPLLTKRQLETVRLAVLCHDIGHCVFSHVSESVIARLPGNCTYPSAALLMDAYSQYAGRRIPMAEVFAATIVTSRSFIKFLRDLGIASRPEHVADLARDAARLILGLPMSDDPMTLFLGQLMSSGLDVDKLDYMLRESHLSGISLGISLDWLLKKLFIKQLPPEELPQELKSRILNFPAPSQFGVLALARGGQFAFEEFCVARLTLHEKIYLHQKIRAAETYVKSRLAKMASIIEGYEECHRWMYVRESQFEYPLLDLPGIAQQDLLNLNRQRNTVGLQLDRIGTRNLLCRSFAFGWFNAIAEPLIETPQATDRLMSSLHGDSAPFIQDVLDNLSKMRKILGDDECPCAAPELLVDLPRITTLQQGHETIYIEHPSRISLRWTMPIDRIVEYYHNHRALGYIFTDRLSCACVLLAAEKAAWDGFQVLYVQEAAVNSMVFKKAQDLKERLHEAGFYSDARPLQPVSAFLNRVYSQTLVSKVAKRLAHYEPRTRRLVSPASVTTYISQFPPDLQEVAVEWLQLIEWIDPGAGVSAAFSQLLENRTFTNLRRIALCPLGATSDSANRIAYDLRDIHGQHPGHILELLPLSEALARRFDAYVFYDDNTNTGHQAVNIVAAWLEKELPRELQLHEEHVLPLESSLRHELISKPMGFAFAVGTEGADKNLAALLKDKLGITETPIHCAISRMLRKDRRVFSGSLSDFQHKDKLRLKSFLEQVAKEVLIGEHRTPEEASRRLLGDGNPEAMVVFPYNCPTMTITALWILGKYRGADWLPLVERARRRHPDTGALIGEDA